MYINFNQKKIKLNQKNIKKIIVKKKEMSNCSKFSNNFFLATGLTSFPASSNEAMDTDAGNQEIIKVREVIPHTGPIPIVIPLRLFLDDINFPADNVTARVTWKFRGGGKVQQILYDATHRFQN